MRFGEMKGKGKDIRDKIMKEAIETEGKVIVL